MIASSIRPCRASALARPNSALPLSVVHAKACLHNVSSSRQNDVCRVAQAIRAAIASRCNAAQAAKPTAGDPVASRAAAPGQRNVEPDAGQIHVTIGHCASGHILTSPSTGDNMPKYQNQPTNK